MVRWRFMIALRWDLGQPQKGLRLLFYRGLQLGGKHIFFRQTAKRLTLCKGAIGPIPSMLIFCRGLKQTEDKGSFFCRLRVTEQLGVEPATKFRLADRGALTTLFPFHLSRMSLEHKLRKGAGSSCDPPSIGISLQLLDGRQPDPDFHC